MTKKPEKETEILNVRWIGKYTMVCDVILDSRTLSDIRVDLCANMRD
jgi:hypothetical protein